MEHGHKEADQNGLTSQKRADLERVVVRLLDIAARCTDASLRNELMELANELVQVIEA